MWYHLADHHLKQIMAIKACVLVCASCYGQVIFAVARTVAELVSNKYRKPGYTAHSASEMPGLES